MNRPPFTSCIALVTSLAVASLPLGSAALAGTSPESAEAPEQPGPPTPGEQDAEDGDDSLDGLLDDLSAPEGVGPIVHVINEMPDENRGLLKLVRYRGTTTQAGGNVIVFTTNYDEICTEPCGVRVDVTDRPILFFVRDNSSVSYSFRLQGDDEITLSLRPHRGGMRMAGFTLMLFLILPAGIPLWVLGNSKVSIAPGAPSPGQKFHKLKKAKL